MLNAEILGALITSYTLAGKDNVDTPIQQLDGSYKTSREMSEESMTKLAQAIIEHFIEHAEFDVYIPGGQPLLTINPDPSGGTPSPGTSITLTATADLETGVVTFDPLPITTPLTVGQTDLATDPARLRGVVKLS